jgi:hypothetical protein
MQLPMMTAAEESSELVADFETQRSGLREPQVMRIGRLPAADQETVLYVNTTANHVDMEIHSSGTDINLTGSDILNHT